MTVEWTVTFVEFLLSLLRCWIVGGGASFLRVVRGRLFGWGVVWIAWGDSRVVWYLRSCGV